MEETTATTEIFESNLPNKLLQYYWGLKNFAINYCNNEVSKINYCNYFIANNCLLLALLYPIIAIKC